jgi:predicted nucleotidyltransferase
VSCTIVKTSSKYQNAMTRDDILATIRANEPHLRELTVRSLALFGFFARRIDREQRHRLLRGIRQKDIRQLHEPSPVAGDLFQRKIDLGIKRNIKPRLREQILSEAVCAA